MDPFNIIYRRLTHENWYYVRVSNSLMANSLEYEFAIANKNLHNAEVSVRSIKRLNEHLPDELKFHGVGNYFGIQWIRW